MRYMYISNFIRCFPHFPNGSVVLYDYNELHRDSPFMTFLSIRF
jgi:hypothetical protein